MITQIMRPLLPGLKSTATNNFLFFSFLFFFITNTTYNTYSYYDTNQAYITYDTTPNY